MDDLPANKDVRLSAEESWLLYRTREIASANVGWRAEQKRLVWSSTVTSAGTLHVNARNTNLKFIRDDLY